MTPGKLGLSTLSSSPVGGSSGCLNGTQLACNLGPGSGNSLGSVGTNGISSPLDPSLAPMDEHAWAELHSRLASDPRITQGRHWTQYREAREWTRATCALMSAVFTRDQMATCTVLGRGGGGGGNNIVNCIGAMHDSSTGAVVSTSIPPNSSHQPRPRLPSQMIPPVHRIVAFDHVVSLDLYMLATLAYIETRIRSMGLLVLRSLRNFYCIVLTILLIPSSTPQFHSATIHRQFNIPPSKVRARMAQKCKDERRMRFGAKEPATSVSPGAPVQSANSSVPRLRLHQQQQSQQHHLLLQQQQPSLDNQIRAHPLSAQPDQHASTPSGQDLTTSSLAGSSVVSGQAIKAGI
ncbi:unnamed protein product [Protopolystoma xenopodis]|uniref:Uncharacterized protein n=1 Tax=Protopolystoma xenopodis TaxID=117903 RepID=A0A448WPF5_9PLAT|nr:unnamed protein product [Protopolystoma xenopodis]